MLKERRDEFFSKLSNIYINKLYVLRGRPEGSHAHCTRTLSGESAV